jgi:hypothetical protein
MKLKRFKEGVWVVYPKAEKVRFKIRPVSFTQTLDLLNQVKEKIVVEGMPTDPRDASKKGPQVIDDYNSGVFLWNMFDRALEEWEGIDPIPEGETEPLAPMELKRIIFDDDAMREFIFLKARELVSGEEKKQEEERKNL